jgi:calcineurin-like phosphoesterase family protein
MVMSVWLTSDHHFGHANILGYCDRQFANVDEMDEALIKAWNDIVDPKDEVWHLGDFTLGDWKMARSYFLRLNGYINVLSNPWHHDSRWIEGFNAAEVYGVKLVEPIAVIPLGDRKVISLSHYPIEVWDRKHYGSYCAHGHSHGVLDADRKEAILDVGVDNVYRLFGEYRPFLLEEALAIMDARREAPG